MILPFLKVFFGICLTGHYYLALSGKSEIREDLIKYMPVGTMGNNAFSSATDFSIARAKISKLSVKRSSVNISDEGRLFIV